VQKVGNVVTKSRSFYIYHKSYSRESREVVSREVVQVVMWSRSLSHNALTASRFPGELLHQRELTLCQHQGMIEATTIPLARWSHFNAPE